MQHLGNNLYRISCLTKVKKACPLKYLRKVIQPAYYKSQVKGLVCCQLFTQVNKIN